ncbi:MAG: site-specific recombinase [Pseudonocardiales bacterium]|nr:site-specific recombinase [Pseudonocardiales bacterium]
MIYCRISQDREGAGLGVERQRADCEALARSLSWAVVETYTDNDLSAYSGKPRPGYRALLTDLNAGRANAVIVWHTDRLHRSPRELEEYITVCEQRSVTTQTVQAGELDLATPSGRAVARTLGAWARYEVEHKSKRTKSAQLQAAQAGKWLGGTHPLGWNVRDDGSATLDRSAARRIRKASADVLAGVSLGSIVNSWNAANFATGAFAHGCPNKEQCRDNLGKLRIAKMCPDRRTRQWNYSTLRQVLTRPRNAGMVDYNGEIVGRSAWPEIVSEDTWRALCAMLADPSRRRSTSNRAKHLLAGIAVCGKPSCGAPLRSATVSNPRLGIKRTVYRCTAPGTGHVARSADDVDDQVRKTIAAWFERENLGDLLAPEDDSVDIADVRAEAVTVRARIRDYQSEAARMDAADYVAPTTTLRTRLAELEAELASGGRRSALAGIVNAGDPVRAWNSAPIDRQRAIVRELLTVTVLPSGRGGRGYDPNLTVIEPRQA